jgi:eukaryotic-like serine/threonine-protein kinase
MGTVAYMSPEQAAGEELDARTDLFSFGAVLYGIATARPASGNISAMVFNAILHKAPTSAVRLNPELPSELDPIVNKAREKGCKLRYQSASEIIVDPKRLKREFEAGRSSSVSRATTTLTGTSIQQRSWPRIEAISALALAGFLALAFVFPTDASPASHHRIHTNHS